MLPFEIISKPKNPAREIDQKFFGDYNCLDCNLQWRSSQAKKNSGQECDNCGKNVFPFKLDKKELKRPLKGGPFFGRFKCLDCNLEWKSDDAYTTQGQKCIECLKVVHPYLVSDEELKGDGPFFGRYKCLECKKDWASSHSWKNTFQKCLKCKIMVLPYEHVSFLL